MARRKTWQEKLADDKDLPKVVPLKGSLRKQWGPGTLAIPSPREINDIMRRVPRGRVITISEIRTLVARKHNATCGCPLTTGIFAWIAAHAAEEAAAAGKKKVTPYWRTLRSGGELNPKYPGGAQRIKRLLEAEGHRVVARGKRLVVADYEKRLVRP
jgi:alkylated DNA nucleotide flippase Atl1